MFVSDVQNKYEIYLEKIQKGKNDNKVLVNFTDYNSNGDIYLSTYSNNVSKILIAIEGFREHPGADIAQYLSNKKYVTIIYEVHFAQYLKKIPVKRRLLSTTLSNFIHAFAFELYLLINHLQENYEHKEITYDSLASKSDNHSSVAFYALLKKIISRLFIRDEWKVAYTNKKINVDSITSSFDEFTVLENPAKEFSADPFIVENDKGVFLFFERCGYSRDAKGYIVCKNLINGHEETVLSEQYHLSYPNVFVYKNEYFMIPQSENKCIDLYHAEQFPFNWKKVKTLLSHEIFSFGDTNIFQNENNMFSLTTSVYDHASISNRVRLQLDFHDLFEDELNFIDLKLKSISDECSRNAGNSSDINQGYYQNCLHTYGGGLVKETESAHVVLETLSFIDGIHTYNSTQNYTVIDFKIKRYGIYIN